MVWAKKVLFFCLVSFGSATFWLSDCTAVPQTTGTERKMYLLRVRRWWSIPGWANRPSPGAWGVPRAWLQWFYPFTEPRRVLFHFTLLLQHRQCGACGFFFFCATLMQLQFKDPKTLSRKPGQELFPHFLVSFLCVSLSHTSSHTPPLLHLPFRSFSHSYFSSCLFVLKQALVSD